MNIQGFIKRAATKDGKGKRGPWTRYSFIMELDNGSESGWIGAGFDKPPFAETSYGSIEVNEGEYGKEYVKDSWKSLSPPTRAPQNTPAPSVAAPSGSGTSTPSKGAYVDRNDSIVYQSSRKDAIQVIALLLENDALPLAAAGAKANTAKRFAEIQAYVNKLTVEFYGDVQTGRVLQQVVDSGATDKASTIAVDGGTAPIDND